MEETKSHGKISRPLLITIIGVFFIVWEILVLLDFTGISSPKMNGEVVNVILGFRVFGTYAKIMDVVQLITIGLMIYGIFKMNKLLGCVLPFVYMVYAFVSVHSWALMDIAATKRAKLGYDIFALIGGGLICLVLYLNRNKFK